MDFLDKVLILDFGSQFTQLITRRIREIGVFSEIQPYDYEIDKIKNDSRIKAIILSGGPDSVYAKNAPKLNKKILDLNLPVLGICYGCQLLAQNLGGEVKPSQTREYGRSELEILKTEDLLFKNLESNQVIWMSHGDEITQIPVDFEVLGITKNCPFAAIKHKQKPIYGLQFHLEVTHTQNGNLMLKNFLFDICNLKETWTAHNFVQKETHKIKEIIETNKVLCALSGGVDSSVVASLIYKAAPDQLFCVFVDNGLLRQNEAKEVEEIFRQKFDSYFTTINAKELFLNRLKEITDPEQKRKIIGKTFIEVFELAQNYLLKKPNFLKITKDLQVLDSNNQPIQNESKQTEEFKFLAQGTLYPDIIESSSNQKGSSHTIKSHHNVGGLPKNIKFKLLEPLKELFKDEVRKIGLDLGLPENLINRHPFPGPGLAVRVIGEITEQKLDILRKTDEIFINELKNNKNPKTGNFLYEEVWQAFAVLTDLKSVGVMGDGRTYENLVGLRAVTAIDGMTADWAKLPFEFLALVSNKIINEVRGVNRVVYDISSKPPATIEWE
jgi:GMP synthase (glutamine-hydrolysing)